MRTHFFFFLLFFMAYPCLGQLPNLTPNAKISILTCGPGEELSSTFGHNAFRITDPPQGLDVVMGYGGFDFDAPYFYYKFTTGKLDYTITAHRFNTFLEAYKQENRWVAEQELLLGVAQKNAIFNALKNNYNQEGWGYKYDFLFDNCATRIPEILEKVMGDQLDFGQGHLTKTSTFRQLIHENLYWNAWDTFGIDLALGAVIDRQATPREHQFLPIYVSHQLTSTALAGKPLSKKKNLLVEAKPVDQRPLFILSPLFFASVFLALVAVITYSDLKKSKRTKWLDFGLFFLSGVAGLLIAFLWFATDHSSTKMNFNILWAFPANIWLAFMVIRKGALPSWLPKSTWILVAGILLVIVLWLFQVQVFSPLIAPLLLALAIRYLYLRHCCINKENA